MSKIEQEAIEILVAEVDADLRAASDPERAAAEQRYLKSPLAFLGTGVPQVRGTVRTLGRAHPFLPRSTVLALVDALWDAPIHERRLAAIEVMAVYHAVLEPDDMAVVEGLCREAGTWALVDPLADTIAGQLIIRWPEAVETLDRWVRDPEMWVRRAGLLALLPSVRRGPDIFARFAGYADLLLDEREFFIRKAIGWVLREVGKRDPESVFVWLAARTDRASGVTVREAVKYLTTAQREAILSAHHERHVVTEETS